MCGSCGTHSVKDWSWPLLAQSRSVTLIARAAERLSRVHGIRILPSPDSWQVRLPTGGTQLVHSLTALARLAQVDSTFAPEVGLAGLDESPIVDRRRMITVNAALSAEAEAEAEAPAPAASSWPDLLMRPDTTVITIDSSDPIAFLGELEALAKTVAGAPYRDHLRLVPIAADLTRTVTVHRWIDLPESIGAEDLPALLLSLACRLVALPQTDARFREARIRYGESGMVQVQSVGATITALSVQLAAPSV